MLADARWVLMIMLLFMHSLTRQWSLLPIPKIVALGSTRTFLVTLFRLV